jgi:hypothetical protein
MYSLLASTTLSSASSSVIFNSIPQTYTHLVLRMSTRLDNVTSFVGAKALLGVAANSTNGRWWFSTQNNTAPANGTADNNFNGIRGLATSYSTSTANAFSTTIMNFPYYVLDPNIPGDYSSNNITSITDLTQSHSACYNVNVGAVDTITIQAPSGNFVTNSSFQLYGIK